MPEPTDVTLRSGQPPDIEAVAHLAFETFGEESYRPFGFRQWLDVSPSGLVIAERGKTLVGYALAASVRGREAAWLLTLCVRAELRKQGIGRILSLDIIDRVKSWGVKTLLLTVDPNNSAAEHLFRSLGFTAIETSEDYFGPRQTRMEMALSVH